MTDYEFAVLADDHQVALAAMAICARLLDNLDDPEALAAARQLLEDNPGAVRRSRAFLAMLPE